MDLVLMPTYSYKVCYEWTDNQGQIHRSAPSPAISYSPSDAIDSTHTATITVPTLRLTAKTSSRSPVSVVAYRTEASGTVYYRVSSITAPTANSTSADSVAVLDAIPDATLVGNTQLYTNGDVVENIAPGPVGSMTTYQSRIVYLDPTNPLQVGYSKQVVPGAPVEFSDLFTLNLDPRGGDGTAVATLDDKLVVFKESSVSVLFGQGPDATGSNNDFQGPQEVSSDAGCVNPRSVVQTPDGVMFKSAKGIYRLNRSLQLEYIGAEVEAYNDDTITSAQLLSSTNQVVFTLDTGRAIVYDYFFNQWSVFRNVAAVDSALWNGSFVYLRSDGEARQETPGEFSDAGSYIPQKWTTSWLQVAGLQGFQRVYRLLLIGDYLSSHKLKISIAYDFNPEPSQVETIDAGTLLGSQFYGGDSPYGETGTVYGGSYPLYQFRIHLAQQKCEAIQITVEDVQSGSAVGESCAFSGYTLEVGVKRGPFKVAAARSVG